MVRSVLRGAVGHGKFSAHSGAGTNARGGAFAPGESGAVVQRGRFASTLARLPSRAVRAPDLRIALLCSLVVSSCAGADKGLRADFPAGISSAEDRSCPMNGALSGPLMLGSAPSDVWAGCHHFDGASFTPYALSPSVVPGAEFAVAGPQSYWVSSRSTRAGATSVYVGRFTLGGGDEDHSAEFDGASATAAPNVVTNGAEAYAVESLASSSRLYRLEGNRFVRTSAALPANARLKFVAGANDVFVTTEAGLMHWDGTSLADAGVASTVYFTASIDGALWAVTPFAMPSRDPIEVRLRRGSTWETQTIAPEDDPARYPLTLTALSGGRLGIVYAEALADGSLATFTRTWDGAALSASTPLRDLSRECGDRCVMNRPSNLGALADGTLMFSAYVGPSRYAAVFFPRSVFER